MINVAFFFSSMDDADMKGICQRFSELLALLDQYEGDVYSDWCHGLDEVCRFSLDQNLIGRHQTTGLLSVNFSSKVYLYLNPPSLLVVLIYKIHCNAAHTYLI